MLFKDNIVKKILKRNYIGHSAKTQFIIQKMAYNICKQNKFKIITIPLVYSYDSNSYTMDKIDDDYEYNSDESSYNYKYVNELKIFYKKFIDNNYFPFDYECYKQKNNKICIIDFDKFIKIDDINNLMYYGTKKEISDLLKGNNVPYNFNYK